ncbi:MAG TPA: VCBS repeat-containing protein [Planctomycetota bacterium]|nr:VCBS repeat-containing protein [Planctomycetota bacterium]
MELDLLRVWISRGAWIAAASLVFASFASAQTFQFAPQRIPQGAPFNNSYTENVDFADVDQDGDWDALFADGGDFGNDQNRLWINLGGAQGGALGVFEDRTAAQCPAILDASRDVDFVDVDKDGDADAFFSNTSQISNQTNRWWINMGGVQGGTSGFFSEATAARYLSLGVNNASTSSSIAPSVVLAAGGFIDWSCDSAFADLDGDGFRDLFQSTYGSLSGGNVPARIFLNDGQGFFEEFNPSGFQLAGTDIANGNPALWAQGIQQHQTTDTTGSFADVATVGMSVSLGDIDGDFDVDVLHGEKYELPRMFRNLAAEQGGALAFRDVSNTVFPANWSSGSGKYQQVFGDLDADGDLDVYGMNWVDFCDSVLTNGGSGVFTAAPVTNSCARESESDLIDYDHDGDLDVIMTRLTGQERMQANAGAGGGFTFAPAVNVLPADTSRSWASDVCDVDSDGDCDVLVANDQNEANALLDNTSGVPDTFAPRIPRLEQAANRSASTLPSIVRAHVYDNAEDYTTGYAIVVLEVAVNGGPFSSVPMDWSGAQVFRGEIPGLLVGAITYRVRASDESGNSGVSATLGFTATPCDGSPFVYCTAKTNSCGATPAISFTGAPSLAATSGFTIEASGARSGRPGLLLYGPNGPASVPFEGALLCVAPQGIRRGPAGLSNGGTPGPLCDAVFRLDFNAFASGNAGGNPAPFLHTLGQRVDVQWWGRDNTAIGSFLSNALQFNVCP